MVRIFGIASLALAIVSAVSGHVIRHKRAPSGWNATILEAYDTYHGRYLEFGCEGKHETPYFKDCCHPLLKNESISVLRDRKCYSDNNCHSLSSTSPASILLPAMIQQTHTSTRASPSLPVYTTTSTTPSPSPTNTDGGSGSYNFGGIATYFYQKGIAGACGEVHPEDALIAAIDSNLYGDTSKKSTYCGRRIEIINILPGKHFGKSVIVIVADACPTCKNTNSIDLSLGAFNKIGDESDGEYSIKWKFL